MMNIKYVLGGIALVFSLGHNASAQLVAGSPEDALFMEITAAANPDDKLALIQQFEDQFPQADSQVLVSIFTTAMRIQTERQDVAGLREYGEKILALNSDDVNALMTLSRSLAVARDDLPTALEYAERAVSAVEAMRTAALPFGYSQEQWDQYVAGLETSANGILGYVRSVSP